MRVNRTSKASVGILWVSFFAWVGCEGSDAIPSVVWHTDNPEVIFTGAICEGECGSSDLCGQCPATSQITVGSSLFRIDATEVSNGDYLVFSDIHYSLARQSEECTWNKTFMPVAGWPPPSAVLNHPVVYVNWCQAQAYCAWAGKRLCGKVGSGAGKWVSQSSTSLDSQWFYACTGGDVNRAFPYGASYVAASCNGREYWPTVEADSVVTGSIASCQAPAIPGLFDMSGNVYEWTDECKTDDNVANRDQICRRRGGSFYSMESLLRCASLVSRVREHVDDFTGFRCCKD